MFDRYKNCLTTVFEIDTNGESLHELLDVLVSLDASIFKEKFNLVLSTTFMTTEANGKLREEEFLEYCFVLLSKFLLDKLRGTVEKEKEDQKTQCSLLWSSFLHQVSIFAELEKSFYSLAFMGHSSNFGSRWLTKREQTLKMRYSCLLTELKKIETVHQDLVPTCNTDRELPRFKNLKQLVNVVGGQLQHFIIARMNIISFYEQLPALTSSKNVSFEDLFKIINSTLEEFLSKNFLPIVACFKDIYRMECEVMVNLLKMQIHLQKCQYLESITSYACSSKYHSAWHNILFSKEARRLTFGNSSHKTWSPELFEWLNKFKGLLLSKFNLYFFEVLCQNGGNPAEVRNNTAKAQFDFYSRIASICKKTDALKILLVLTNLNELEESSRRQGYFLPSKIDEDDLVPLNILSDASDTNSHNSISSSLLSTSSPESAQPNKIVFFEYPQDKSQSSVNYHSTLFGLLDSKKMELDQLDKIVTAVDEMSQHSYVMMRIEGSIYLVTILNKKNVRDANLINFYNSLSSDLRCNKLFVSWKQGTK